MAKRIREEVRLEETQNLREEEKQGLARYARQEKGRGWRQEGRQKEKDNIWRKVRKKAITKENVNEKETTREKSR